jgi:hypothetical protein
LTKVIFSRKTWNLSFARGRGARFAMAPEAVAAKD